jgi:hypothetical protein
LKFVQLPGLIFSQDNYWVETRREVHKLLREFGFGKTSKLEPLLIEELEELKNDFKSKFPDGVGVVEIDKQFHCIFLNSIWSILTGKRFQHSDPQLHEFVRATAALTSSQQIGGGIIGMFPGIVEEYVPYYLSGLTKYQKSSQEMCRFFQVFTQ